MNISLVPAHNWLSMAGTKEKNNNKKFFFFVENVIVYVFEPASISLLSTVECGDWQLIVMILLVILLATTNPNIPLRFIAFTNKSSAEHLALLSLQNTRRVIGPSIVCWKETSHHSHRLPHNSFICLPFFLTPLKSHSADVWLCNAKNSFTMSLF